MKHAILFKCSIVILATLFLMVTGCRGSVSLNPDASISTSHVGAPTLLDGRPLCGLTLPEEDSPWRQVWRTDYEAGGIRDLIRDGDWLWVATPVDVVRLDLRTLACTRFELSGISNLLLDPDGRLWATTGGNLVRFDGQNWQAFLVDRAATDLAFDKKGNLWTRVSLYRSGIGWLRYPGHEPPDDGSWNGEVFGPLDEYESDYEYDRWIARSGSFRSIEERRLLTTWRRRLVFLAPPEGIAPWGENPRIAAETDDRLWMLAQYLQNEHGYHDALLSFDGRNWQMLPWPYGPARLVADEARGGVWAGTGEGLIFSDGRSIQKYLLMPGDAVPAGPTVYDLVVDGRDRLWASTDRGLLLYDEALDAWQSSEIGVRVLISADYQGGLWAASSYYVGHFDGNTWSHHYPFPRGWPCSPVVDILADVGGGLWWSSYHCTLRGFNGEVWDEYDNGSRGDLLARGPGGAVYAAQGSDIKRYDGTTWNRLPSIKVPRPTGVTDITIGPEGEVWVTLSASPNLIVYRGNEWEKFPELAGKEITALLIDSQGDLWAGYNAGLLHYDGETWERIEREIPFSAINALAEDRHGRIWVGGRDGLSVYDPREE